MQKKTIKNIVTNKMSQWLETIIDEKLREKVRAELLVSGGCIASLFLNEDVNDFDVYIKTPETAFELAKYYVKDLPLEVFMGKDKEKYLKEIIGDDDETLLTGKSVFLSGLLPEQVKIFCGLGKAGYAVESPSDGMNKFVPTFFSPNAISLTDKVQIVLRFTGGNKEIHSNFDFVHATNYFTFKEGIVTNLEALESLISKQLRYQGSKYPLTSVIRTKKFIKRKWNISAGEYLKMMFQISELDLSDPKVLEQQLIGVDIAYFSLFLDILKGKMEKDPNFRASTNYVNTIIDKVFNDSNTTD